MGFNMRNIFRRVSAKKEMQIVMVGLEAPHNFNVGRAATTVPTVGFNIETVQHKNFSFTIWEIGGHEKILSLWRHHLNNAQGLIFVLDGNDRERINEARDMLHNILKEETLREAALLVFADKKGFPNTMSAAEITEKLQLQSLPRRHWHVQSFSSTSRKGLYQGLDWLSKIM